MNQITQTSNDLVTAQCDAEQVEFITFDPKLYPEFKEDVKDAGYNLREIKSNISDSNVRILWPDEQEDIEFLENWVQKRVDKLDNGKYVTLAYDSEGVCLQFGDIYDENFDYYNWDPNDYNVPQIKTNESIIITLYKHKGDYSKDPILVNKMKPLLEHQRIIFMTFDFTFDFDTLYKYDVNITTDKVIDIQLSKLPQNYRLNKPKDLICATGWHSLYNFICLANEDNVNAKLVSNAKIYITNDKKNFPRDENHFLCKQFEYPEICQFTKEYLQYSAGDIFYTAIAGTDILTLGNFSVVKERSQSKLKSYHEYREEYGCVKCVRNAYYAGNSLDSTIQKGFSNESKTSKIVNLYKNLNSFVELLNKPPELLQTAIPSFNDDYASIIYEEYDDIVDIMKDTEGVHLRNIKENARLAFVHGIKKTPAFTLQYNEEEEETYEEIKIKISKEDEEKEKEVLDQITGGGKKLFKKMTAQLG